ncbi:hypothetical protein LSH36_31g09045, partial [Paralvinella palmiformis]
MTASDQHSVPLHVRKCTPACDLCLPCLRLAQIVPHAQCCTPSADTSAPAPAQFSVTNSRRAVDLECVLLVFSFYLTIYLSILSIRVYVC